MSGRPRRPAPATVLDALAVGVLVLDRDRRVHLVNRAAARLLGAPAVRDGARPLLDVVRQPALLAVLEEALAGAPVRERRVTVAIGGEPRELEVHASADDGGAGVVVTLHDVTRLARLETVRREFVANVSHELKTPVTSIQGFAELLAERPDLPAAERERYLAIVRRQAARLGVIIEDLLTLSRLERDPGALRELIAEQPVRPLLEAAVAGCPPVEDEGDVPPVIRCPDDLRWPVAGDLLEQAVLNLVDNARKHGGGDRPVEVVAAERDGCLHVAVVDHGRGIASRHLPRLFERFYRVDKDRSRRRGGTGLGLAIVKHIARVHGGDVTVESEPGRGSIFTLVLPRPA